MRRARKTFDPGQLPGLNLWLKADDLSNLIDGASVNTWYDRSPAKNHATAAATVPTFQSKRFNGRGAVVFGGGSTEYFSLSSTLAMTQRTIFFVAKNTDTTNGSVILGGSASATQYMFLRHEVIANDAQSSCTSDPNLGIIATIGEHYNTGTTGTVLVNGSTSVSNSQSGTMTLDRIGSGGVGSTLNMEGDIYEIISYNRTLCDEERRKIRVYLGNYYGLGASRIICSDSFNRPDSASTLGVADTGQSWTAQNGTWGISSNKAYNPSADTSGSQGAIATIYSGTADVDIRLNILSDPTADKQAGTIFRLSDSTHYYLAYLYHAGFSGTTSVGLVRVNGGSSVALFDSGAISPSYPATIRVLTNGNNLSVWYNNILVGTTSDSFNNTATNHGLNSYNTNSANIDNLEILRHLILT